VTIGIVCLVLQVFLPYQRTLRYLKWLTLALAFLRRPGADDTHPCTGREPRPFHRISR